MRVLYDFQAFSLQRFGGVSRCFAELASNMPDDISAEVAILESDNVYLKEKGLVPALKPLSISRQSFLGGVDSPAKEFLFNALNYVPFAHTPKTVNRAFSIKRLESGEFDVFHPTFFDGYFLPHLHGTPFVLTVHDLTVDRMYDKGDKAYRQVVDRNRLLDRAARIVAVSGNTADDLVSLAGVDRNRISVIYHGAPDVDLDALRLHKPAVDGRYLLFVGSRSVSYKNFGHLDI